MDRPLNARVVASALICVLMAVVSTGCGPKPGRAVAPATSPGTSAVAPMPSPWTVVSTSEQGRPIEAASYGNGPRQVLVVAGCHGDEAGPEYVRELVRQLETGRFELPDDVTVYIVRDLNPDGRAAGTRGNANGVDINRNMPTENWRSRLHKRDRAAKEGLTGGDSPGSEAGTKVLLDFLGKGVSRVITLHSQGGFVDWDGDGAEALATRVGSAMNLPVDHLPYQDYIGGSLGVYAREKGGVQVLTVELSDEVAIETGVAGILEALR